MKNSLVLTTTLVALMAAPAFAGGLAEPIMSEPMLIEEVATPSSGSGMLPFIIFAMLIAVSNG